MASYNIYTDASVNLKNKTAAVGYLLVKKQKELKKTVYILGDINQSQEAENYAIILALKDTLIELQPYDNIILRTDQIKLIKDLPNYDNNNKFVIEIREIQQNYQNKSIKLSIEYIESHKKNLERNDKKYFHHISHNKIDKACNKVLRGMYLPTLKINNNGQDKNSIN